MINVENNDISDTTSIEVFNPLSPEMKEKQGVMSVVPEGWGFFKKGFCSKGIDEAEFLYACQLLNQGSDL